MVDGWWVSLKSSDEEKVQWLHSQFPQNERKSIPATNTKLWLKVTSAFAAWSRFKEKNNFRSGIEDLFQFLLPAVCPTIHHD